MIFDEHYWVSERNQQLTCNKSLAKLPNSSKVVKLKLAFPLPILGFIS